MKNFKSKYEQESLSPKTAYIFFIAVIVFALIADSLFN